MCGWLNYPCSTWRRIVSPGALDVSLAASCFRLAVHLRVGTASLHLRSIQSFGRAAKGASLGAPGAREAGEALCGSSTITAVLTTCKARRALLRICPVRSPPKSPVLRWWYGRGFVSDDSCPRSSHGRHAREIGSQSKQSEHLAARQRWVPRSMIGLIESGAVKKRPCGDGCVISHFERRNGRRQRGLTLPTSAAQTF